jgi:hypothetical protein
MGPLNGLVCWGKSEPETIDFPIFSHYFLWGFPVNFPLIQSIDPHGMIFFLISDDLNILGMTNSG